MNLREQVEKLLTRRHAKVRQRAEDAHREKWGGKVDK
jgi:hypothetical protein